MSELKLAKTYDEQVDLLIHKHALIIKDREYAKHILAQVSYYRLSAYGLSLRRDDNHDLYREGTTFEQIYTLYRFDSNLRNILLPLVERMEIEHAQNLHIIWQ